MNKRLLAEINCLKYLLAHKFFVFVAGLKTGTPVGQLLVHDLSKFRPSEWAPYRDHYHIKTKDTKDAYTRAWLKHVHRNPHHWQHWLVTSGTETTALEIPERYAREMVADWFGAGRALSGRWEAAEWYGKQTMLLHPETKKFVEALLWDTHDELVTYPEARRA